MKQLFEITSRGIWNQNSLLPCELYGRVYTSTPLLIGELTQHPVIPVRRLLQALSSRRQYLFVGQFKSIIYLSTPPQYYSFFIAGSFFFRFDRQFIWKARNAHVTLAHTIPKPLHYFLHRMDAALGYVTRTHFVIPHFVSLSYKTKKKIMVS